MRKIIFWLAIFSLSGCANSELRTTFCKDLVEQSKTAWNEESQYNSVFNAISLKNEEGTVINCIIITERDISWAF